MKPTSVMEDKKGNVSVDVRHEDNASVKISSHKGYSKLVTRTAVALVSLMVVSGVVLGAVYFGMRLTSEHIKETWVTFQNQDGATVHEKVTVTGSEEDYETDTVRSIYDFNSMLVVYKFTGKNACYVTNMNETEVDKPSKLYSNLTETQWDTTSDPIKQKFFTGTNIELSHSLLSPRGRDMCKFNKVYWMVQQTEAEHSKNGLVKRRAAEVSASSCCCTCGRCCRCGMSFSESMAMSDMNDVGAVAVH